MKLLPWQIENIATMACTVALILGALALGAGGHSWWGLLLLLNMNGTVRKSEDKKAGP